MARNMYTIHLVTMFNNKLFKISVALSRKQMLLCWLSFTMQYCAMLLLLHGWMYVRIYVEIRKIEMCILRSPYIDNFQNKKN